MTPSSSSTVLLVCLFIPLVYSPSTDTRVEALKSLGVIPHTPVSTPSRSPTPVWERDEDTLNKDELYQVVRHFKQRHEKNLRIKREREESEDTLVDDDGEIQWVMTQPSGAARKRQRALPTARDEVIELDE